MKINCRSRSSFHFNAKMTESEKDDKFDYEKHLEHACVSRLDVQNIQSLLHQRCNAISRLKGSMS